MGAQEAAEARGFNPEPRHRLWRDVILPRTVVPLAWLYGVLLLPAWLIGLPARRRRRSQPVVVAVESGRIGWTQVYFEELLGSLEDYVGADAVRKQVVDRDLPYRPQFRAHQRRDDPSHLVLDVRTPPNRWRSALVDAYAVAWNVLAHGRTPVVVLTDAFHRRQRWHAGVLTCLGGVAVSFAPRRVMRPLFPHGRVIAPLPMPISRARLAWLEEVAREYPHDGTLVSFIGFAYPPRTLLLEAVGARLAERGITLTVHGDKSATNEQYWRTLAAADVVLTTCMQGPDRPFMDWIWEQQMVHRYHEATAAGSALVAARVEGTEAFFTPGVDFVEFVSVDDAVEAITALVHDPERRRRIAGAGHARSVEFVTTGLFWRAVDERLSSPMRRG